MSIQSKPNKIMIGTPCLNGMCHAQYAMSLAVSMHHYAANHDIHLVVKMIMQEAVISRARNLYAAFCLADPEITHLLFIDSDIQWKAPDIARLIQHDKPIVAGVYPKKTIHWERVNKAFLEQLLQRGDDDAIRRQMQTLLQDYAFLMGENRKVEQGLLEVESAGTGFMLIKREVFETIAKAQPERKIEFKSEPEYEVINPYAYQFFDLKYQDKKYLSEDYSFCQLWRSCGGKVFVDLSIQLAHMGLTPYRGYLTDMINP